MKAQQFGMTCWEGGRMDKLHYTTLDDFLKVNNLFWLGQRDETEVEWVKIQSLTGAQSVISDFEDGERGLGMWAVTASKKTKMSIWLTQRTGFCQ